MTQSPNPKQNMWDQRFSETGYAYGKKPNEFLASVAGRLQRGKALCLGAGEGRNAVWLATQGFDVEAVDLSSVGLEKARHLAAEMGTTIQTTKADLTELEIPPLSYDLVTEIWCHLPLASRKRLHEKIVLGLRPGGALVLEAYTPAQLQFGTGGPKNPELLFGLRELRQELAGLQFAHGAELERRILEGRCHTGPSAVVQVLALKVAE